MEVQSEVWITKEIKKLNGLDFNNYLSNGDLIRLIDDTPHHLMREEKIAVYDKKRGDFITDHHIEPLFVHRYCVKKGRGTIGKDGELILMQDDREIKTERYCDVRESLLKKLKGLEL